MRIFVITKKTLILIAAAGAVLIAAAIAAVLLFGGKTAKARETSALPDSYPDPVYSKTNVKAGELLPAEECREAEVLAGFKKELPVYSVFRNDKKIALTIDAAWDDDKTPFILETLKKYDIKATFFLCGFWVKAYPDMVKAIYDAGHSIGNHSMTHPHMTKLGEAQMLKEMDELDDLLEKLTGERPKLFRAPFGEYNDAVIKTVRASGREPIQWDIDTIDWKPERSSQKILDSVLPKIKDGCIILCHNNGYKIEEYLPTLIETAIANGYEFVTVDELLLKGDTVIDVNGVQKLE
ncbi:MAG: polysaccharide deacetylase family protein [Clostridiales bacterium]|nr:polysaccharide deacetylase family protein [Clostridiales bacterium]